MSDPSDKSQSSAEQVAETLAFLGVAAHTDLGDDATLRARLVRQIDVTTEFSVDAEAGPTPGSALLVSPLWLREDGGVLVQRLGLFPSRLRNRFFAPAVVNALKKHLELVILFMRRATTHPMDVGRAVVATFELWHDDSGPSRRSEIPYPPNARLASFVLVDVARKLHAGLSAYEIGATYGVAIEDFLPPNERGSADAIRATARAKVEAMEREEASWLAELLQGP